MPPIVSAYRAPSRGYVASANDEAVSDRIESGEFTVGGLGRHADASRLVHMPSGEGVSYFKNLASQLAKAGKVTVSTSKAVGTVGAALLNLSKVKKNYNRDDPLDDEEADAKATAAAAAMPPSTMAMPLTSDQPVMDVPQSTGGAQRQASQVNKKWPHWMSKVFPGVKRNDTVTSTSPVPPIIIKECLCGSDECRALNLRYAMINASAKKKRGVA